MFADDLQIYVHCRLSEINLAISNINKDLQALTGWCENHGLLLNPKKSQVPIIGKKSQTNIINYNLLNKVVINSVPLNFSKFTKKLGVIFDENLTWSKFVSAISQKMYFSLRKLYVHRSYTPQCVIINLINFMLFPILD